MKTLIPLLTGLVIGGGSGYYIAGQEHESDLKVRLAYWINRDYELLEEIERKPKNAAALARADIVCTRDLLESLMAKPPTEYREYVAEALAAAKKIERTCTDFNKE